MKWMEARNSCLPNVFKDVWLSTEKEAGEGQDTDPNIVTCHFHVHQSKQQAKRKGLLYQKKVQEKYLNIDFFPVSSFFHLILVTNIYH